MSVFRRPERAAAVGDPIPFSYGGKTHLFYLSSPEGPLDYPGRVRTSWQHMASDDLTTWTELPPAIEPGEPGSLDAGGIWTGSVVEDAGTFYLFYTAHDPNSAQPQTVALATSIDLVTFQRHPANPLVKPTAECESVDWRDPFVFYNDEEQRWWMLIAARRQSGPVWRRGVVMLATSSDLIHWDVEPEPLYDPRTTFCPECPELWQLDGRWYLVYSQFSGDVGTVYRIADTPRGPFRKPTHDALGGRRWYAAKSAPTAGGRVFFGWVHDRVDDDERGRRWLWGGDFATPRIVAPADDGTLLVRPVPGAWRPDRHLARCRGTVDAPGIMREIDIIGGLPSATVCSVTFSAMHAAAIGVAILDEDDTGVRLVIDARTGDVDLRLDPPPLDDFWADLTKRPAAYREVDGPTVAHAHLDLTSSIRLDLVLDGELMEVYISDQVALTWRIERSAATRFTAFVEDGDANVEVCCDALTL